MTLRTRHLVAVLASALLAACTSSDTETGDTGTKTSSNTGTNTSGSNTNTGGSNTGSGSSAAVPCDGQCTKGEQICVVDGISNKAACMAFKDGTFEEDPCGEKCNESTETCVLKKVSDDVREAACRKWCQVGANDGTCTGDLTCQKYQDKGACLPDLSKCRPICTANQVCLAKTGTENHECADRCTKEGSTDGCSAGKKCVKAGDDLICAADKCGGCASNEQCLGESKDGPFRCYRNCSADADCPEKQTCNGKVGDSKFCVE